MEALGCPLLFPVVVFGVEIRPGPDLVVVCPAYLHVYAGVANMRGLYLAKVVGCSEGQAGP